jgi:hypothetical protein
MKLSQLKKALEPLRRFGNEEENLEIETDEGTIKAVLRALLPSEETYCNQFARDFLGQVMEEEGLELTDKLPKDVGLRYLDAFRTEVVSFALVQIGEMDLRSVQEIEDDDGMKIARHVAIRNLIKEGWSRSMLTIAFSRYGDLVTRIAQKAEKIAKDSVEDLDVRIRLTEKRLENLKRERERRAQGDPSITAEQIRSLVAAGEAFEKDIEEGIEVAQELRERAEALAHDQEAARVPEPEPEPVRTKGPPSPIPDRVPPPSPKPTPPADPAAELAALEQLRLAQEAAARHRQKSLEEQGLRPVPTQRTMKGPNGEDVPVFEMGAGQDVTVLSSRKGDKRHPQDTRQGRLDPTPGAGTRNPNFKPRK